MHHTSGATPADRAPVLIFAATLALLGLAALYGMVRAFGLPVPIEGWEAALVVEGWRSAHGLPVYELPPGHATHMYGALVPWLYGLVERATGPSLQATRGLTVAASAATVAMLSWAANRAAPRAWWLILTGAGLLLAADSSLQQYLVRGRPDMPAFAVATGGLLLLYGASYRRSMPQRLMGCVLMVVAVFIKQPMAVLAAVPLVAALLSLMTSGTRGALHRLAIAALPAICVALALLPLSLVAPAVHHYMIAVPAAYHVERARVVQEGMALLVAIPLVWTVLAQRLLDRRSPFTDAERWTLAAAIVTLPAESLMVAKVGGTENSWLPGVFALLFFCLLRLPALVSLLDERRLSLGRRLALSLLLSLVATLTFPRLWRNFTAWTGDPVDALTEYDDVERRVAALPAGSVVGPNLTLMVLRARGTVSRDLWLEHDAYPEDGRWSHRIPPAARAEIEAARFVVLAPRDWHEPLLVADTLAAMGFRQRDVLGRFSIWEQAR